MSIFFSSSVAAMAGENTQIFLLFGGDGRNILINFSKIFLVLRNFSLKRGENYGDEWYYKKLD